MIQGELNDLKLKEFKQRGVQRRGASNCTFQPGSKQPPSALEIRRRIKNKSARKGRVDVVSRMSAACGRGDCLRVAAVILIYEVIQF